MINNDLFKVDSFGYASCVEPNKETTIKQDKNNYLLARNASSVAFLKCLGTKVIVYICARGKKLVYTTTYKHINYSLVLDYNYSRDLSEEISKELKAISNYDYWDCGL